MARRPFGRPRPILEVCRGPRDAGGAAHVRVAPGEGPPHHRRGRAALHARERVEIRGPCGLPGEAFRLGYMKGRSPVGRDSQRDRVSNEFASIVHVEVLRFLDPSGVTLFRLKILAYE